MLVCCADFKSLLWIAKYFALTGACWALHATHSSSLCVVFMRIVVLSYYSFAAACITHNTMHTRCFSSTTAERVYRLLLTMAYGHPVSTFVPGHNLSHHRHLQSKRDPMRTGLVSYKCHILNLLLFQPTVAPEVARMDMRYTHLQRDQNMVYYTHVCTEWAVLVASQCACLLCDWRRFGLYLLLPHLFAQWAIVSMNLIQHDGCEQQTKSTTTNAVTPVNYNTSRNFTGALVNFLTFNNGFHTIHHLYPTMHWSRLPHEHDKIKHNIHPQLNQVSMPAYLYTTFVSPGTRLHYLGGPMLSSGDEGDNDQHDDGSCADWIQDHKASKTPKGSLGTAAGNEREWPFDLN